jgi:hypothetical protein
LTPAASAFAGDGDRERLADLTHAVIAESSEAFDKRWLKAGRAEKRPLWLL